MKMRVTTSRNIHLFLREKENEINEILHKSESPKDVLGNQVAINNNHFVSNGKSNSLQA